MSQWFDFARWGSSRSRYEVSKLIDQEFLSTQSAPPKSGWQVICDIDKTYLETEFESILQLAKRAFEDATSKKSVFGAKEVLRAIRWSGVESGKQEFPVPVHFVSSSPPQLRTVLREKLASDGIDWSSDTFKNQAYNISHGRLDLLRHHVAYKAAAILQHLRRGGRDIQYLLIGDNAESDPFIYFGITMIASGRLSPQDAIAYFEASGIPKDLCHEAIGEPNFAEFGQVRRIFIRMLPGSKNIVPLHEFGIYGFLHYFEIPFSLLDDIPQSEEYLFQLLRQFHNHGGLTMAKVEETFGARIFKQIKSEEMKTLVSKVLRRLGISVNSEGWNMENQIDCSLVSKSLTPQRILEVGRDLYVLR